MSSDPAGGRYHLLMVEEMENGNLEVLTRRNGSSGTSYSRREINCSAPRSYRYLGDGDTRTEAEADAPNPGDMSELVSGSISSDVAEYVCRLDRP